MTIRVLVADDQSMVRAGFRMLLSGEDDIEVVAEASNGIEAVEKAARFAPTVVLMDIRMPELDGLEATRRILAADPEARVLVLTTFDLDEYVYEALRAGASGFVLKDDPPEQLLEAVRTVASGEALLSPAITKRVIREFTRMARPSPPKELDDLSTREREVLRLIALGLSNAQIGQELFISETTVKTHVTHILSKLGLRDRVQVVVLAYQTGIVDADGSARRRRPRFVELTPRGAPRSNEAPRILRTAGRSDGRSPPLGRCTRTCASQMLGSSLGHRGIEARPACRAARSVLPSWSWSPSALWLPSPFERACCTRGPSPRRADRRVPRRRSRSSASTGSGTSS